MARTIIVSNRLPVSVKKVDGKLEFARSDGGLASGLASYTQNRSSVWVGWPGIASDELTVKEQAEVRKELKKQGLLPVFLTKKQVDGFYNGYSNSVLWPLFHNLPLSIKDADVHWKIYKQVNEAFTEAVAGVTKADSRVWVHDYQLTLLPRQLQKYVEKSVSIGFFLHIPFPNFKTLQRLPQAKQILRGMLGASLVGFHTTAYGDEFLNCCKQLGIGTVSENQVLLESRAIKIADFPIGIDYNKFASAIESKAVQQEVAKLRRKYGKYRLILTVDRLDPSKGFVERLEAFFEFLNINPHLHQKVKMLMLTIPSRTEVKAYARLKERIDQLVEMINDTYGTPSWQPIDFMYKSVPFEELSALYQVADVAFVAPIKDGMNLVAKEFIASKQRRGGVLILSETAGAAQELTEAVLVNPKRKQSLVRGLEQALAMPQTVLGERLGQMQQRLSKNTINTWARGFMDTMERTTNITRRLTIPLTTGRTKKLIRDYKDAKRRLFLLDYDGTLAYFDKDPAHTPLRSAVYKNLKKLGADKHNQLVILSGRTRSDLNKYVGSLPLDMAAEHGAFIKQNGSWQPTIDLSTEWKKHVLPFLEAYTQRTPGSHVEVKKHALVWHYRAASVYTAQKNLAIIKRVIKPELKQYGLKAYDGKKVLEIKPPAVNKGNVVRRWLKKSPDFIIAIGDDKIDEEMFTSLPARAYTIKVGRGKTAAEYRLRSISAVHDLLEKLTN